MRALVLKEPLSIAAGECPDLNSEPRPGCALIRVRSIGVCGSDLHAFRGHHPFVTYPRVLGHELGCEVLAIGANDRGISVGDHVCVEPLLTCGKCYPCRQGRYNCCVNIKVLGIHTDGGMTERIEVPVERLHKPKIDLSYDELALCETLSIGVQAVKRGGVVSGQNVVVVGAGPIGLGAMIAARAKGAKVLVIDPIELNRKTALEMGADAVVDPSHEDDRHRDKAPAGRRMDRPDRPHKRGHDKEVRCRPAGQDCLHLRTARICQGDKGCACCARRSKRKGKGRRVGLASQCFHWICNKKQKA